MDRTRGFAGLIDELRVSAVARSNARMRAEHASINDAMLTFGEEETRP